MSCLVDQTMNMCEHYLTEIYPKISRTSSCRCIGKAGCLRYNLSGFKERLWLFGKIRLEGGIRASVPYNPMEFVHFKFKFAIVDLLEIGVSTGLGYGEAVHQFRLR